MLNKIIKHFFCLILCFYCNLVSKIYSIYSFFIDKKANQTLKFRYCTQGSVQKSVPATIKQSPQNLKTFKINQGLGKFLNEKNGLTNLLENRYIIIKSSVKLILIRI